MTRSGLSSPVEGMWSAFLAVEVLDADLRRHLGGQDFDVVLEEWQHLLDHQNPVASREALLHEVRWQGPCRAHLQEPHPILDAENGYCLAAVEGARAARYQQELGFFGSFVGVERRILEQSLRPS